MEKENRVNASNIKIFILVVLGLGIFLGLTATRALPSVAATSSSSASSHQGIPQDVLTEALKEIETFKALAENNPVGFGLTSTDDLQQIKLGPGYPLRKLNKSYNWRHPGSLQQQSQLSNEWEFIVLLEDQPLSLMVIAWDNYSQSYRLVSAGGDASLFINRVQQFNSLLDRNDGEPWPEVITIRNWRLLLGSKDDVEYAMFEVMPGSTHLQAEQESGSLLTSREAIRLLQKEGVLTSGLSLWLGLLLLLTVGASLWMVTLKRRKAAQLP